MRGAHSGPPFWYCPALAPRLSRALSCLRFQVAQSRRKQERGSTSTLLQAVDLAPTTASWVRSFGLHWQILQSMRQRSILLRLMWIRFLLLSSSRPRNSQRRRSLRPRRRRMLDQNHSCRRRPSPLGKAAKITAPMTRRTTRKTACFVPAHRRRSSTGICVLRMARRSSR